MFRVFLWLTFMFRTVSSRSMELLSCRPAVMVLISFPPLLSPEFQRIAPLLRTFPLILSFRELRLSPCGFFFLPKSTLHRSLTIRVVSCCNVRLATRVHVLEQTHWSQMFVLTTVGHIICFFFTMNRERKIKKIIPAFTSVPCHLFCRESVSLSSEKIPFKLKTPTPLSPPTFEDASSYIRVLFCNIRSVGNATDRSASFD